MAEQRIRQYKSFRGVDFTSDPSEVADYRFADAQNVWRDYENGNGNMIETVPGFRSLGNLKIENSGTITEGGKINGIHHYKTTDKDGKLIDYVIVHAGKNLFYRAHGAKDGTPFTQISSGTLYNLMADARSSSVVANNRLWIIDGIHYYFIEPDSQGLTAVSVEDAYGEAADTSKVSDVEPAYIPITVSNNESYEQENMLKKSVNEKYDNKSVTDYIKDGVARYELINPFKNITKVLLSDTVVKELPSRESEREDGAFYWSYNESDNVLTIHKWGEGTIENNDLKDKTLLIRGTLSELTLTEANKYPSFYAGGEDQVSAKYAILGCTEICVFDGRIFLTGNPKFPNRVFFTALDDTGTNNPTYFGIHNWFDTGIGMTPNKAMLAASGVLMVFKGDTAQDGSIYYCTPFDTGVNYAPRQYAVTQGAAGVGCLGAAFNFLDDPVFITCRGLDAVEKQATNLERAISHRSLMVDKRLLAEDLSRVRMAQWKGYLVLSVDGRMYLADGRALFSDDMGRTQYEWFLLDGIGTYSAKETVYRYDVSTDGFNSTSVKAYVKEGHENEIVDAPVTSYETATGSTTGSTENDVTYAVYTEGEEKAAEGAMFFPATEIKTICDVLYFGTDNSDVLCFNTDKRGEVPDAVAAVAGDIQYDDPVHELKHVIPQKYYTFDGIRYFSGVITKTDHVGAPQMYKHTRSKSLVLRCGADPRTSSKVIVDVGTDREVFHEVDRKDASQLSMSSMDFESLSFGTYPVSFLIFNEAERNWIEKRYKIYSDSFCGILRLHSLSYRYEIGGTIRE